MFKNLARLIAILVFSVVVWGALVRLSDAGLACGGWPGCFGQLGMPNGQVIAETSQPFPGAIAPDLGKARLAMSYRYLTGLTAVAVIALWLASSFVRVHRKAAVILATGLVASFVLHIGFDFMAVHFKLMPSWVLGQLLSGLLALVLSFWIVLRIDPETEFSRNRNSIGHWVKFSLVVLLVEITLGAWTAANYAALACPDFPTCSGSWWPRADYFNIFSVFRGLDFNYQGGVLSHEARIAINWLHRLGAFLSFVVLGGLSLSLSSLKQNRKLSKAGVFLSGLLLVQIASGIANVIYRMPISAALVHSAVAAFLLLTVVYVHFWMGRTALVTTPQDFAEPEITPPAAIAEEAIPVSERVPEIQLEADIQAEPVSLFRRLSSQL
ncbi:MAG: COX15/CtaA family protein, partial [Methylococcales bacterium]